MGCDIHTFVERYDGSEWELVNDAVFEDPYYSLDRPLTTYNTPFTNQPWTRRDYSLFELLAGVRSDLDKALKPPAGIPGDASRGWREYCDDWGDGLHSHTWYSLEELESAARHLPHEFNEVVGKIRSRVAWYEDAKVRVVMAFDN